MVEFLEAVKADPKHTRVFGTVSRVTGWEGYDGAFTPVKDAQITLTGPNKATVSTDANGRFVVKDVPKGLYSVTARLGGAVIPIEEPWNEFLFGRDATSCEELPIVIPATGQVDIAVLAEDGQPVKDAFVYLLSADHIDEYGDRPGLGYTLAEGRAVVGEIPAGRYMIAMNPGSGPMPGWPFLEAFSPVFVVEEGKTATPPPLRVQRASKIAISGVVRNASGAPVPDAQIEPWIQLQNGKHSTDWPHPKTDRAGRFTVELWKDQRYVISVGAKDDPWGRIELIADGRPIEITAIRR
jgi:hypothetical protein